jgi:hypothetical protein
MTIDTLLQILAAVNHVFQNVFQNNLSIWRVLASLEAYSVPTGKRPACSAAI